MAYVDITPNAEAKRIDLVLGAIADYVQSGKDNLPSACETLGAVGFDQTGDILAVAHIVRKAVISSKCGYGVSADNYSLLGELNCRAREKFPDPGVGRERPMPMPQDILDLTVAEFAEALF